MAQELIYAYCLSRQSADVSLNKELDGIVPVNHNGFYVYTKGVSSDEFSQENLKKNLSDMKWIETHVRNHNLIISILMQQVTVVPFNFGTVYQSADSLKQFLDEYEEALLNNVRYVENKQEWSVKIYSDHEKLKANIDKLSSEAAEMERKIKESSKGKAYILKRKKAEFVENEIKRLNKVYGQDIYEQIKAVSEDCNLNDLLAKEATGREEKMILNTNFLVSNHRINEFKNTVGTMQQEGNEKGFILDATGPWPPYSFISLKGEGNG